MWDLVNKFLDRENKRKGIIRIEKIGNSDINRGKTYETIYEVEEIQNINGLSKIRINDISYDKSELSDWVDENKVEWARQ